MTNHKELARMPAWEAKFPVLMDQLFGLSGFRHVALSKAKTFYVIVSWYKFHALVRVILLMVFMTKVRNVLTEAISDIERLIVLSIEFGNRARAWIRVK